MYGLVICHKGVSVDREGKLAGKNRNEPLPCTKIILGCVIGIRIKCETINFLRMLWKISSYFGQEKFILIKKPLNSKEKINKFNHIKIKNFCSPKIPKNNNREVPIKTIMKVYSISIMLAHILKFDITKCLLMI